jgi:predicted helicase
MSFVPTALAILCGFSILRCCSELNWRVEKMRVNKDKACSLQQLPHCERYPRRETYEYRLVNRSALEWIIDQYQIN